MRQNRRGKRGANAVSPSDEGENGSAEDEEVVDVVVIEDLEPVDPHDPIQLKFAKTSEASVPRRQQPQRRAKVPDKPLVKPSAAPKRVK